MHVLRVNVFHFIFGWFSIATEGLVSSPGRWMLDFAMIIADYAIPAYIAEFTAKHIRAGFCNSTCAKQ
ncbi:hypothetical protein SOVF_105070 [Spinacia oleracea]|nr:hypothetical protein SOVF_105070 [Spinacia oleracea]